MTYPIGILRKSSVCPLQEMEFLTVDTPLKPEDDIPEHLEILENRLKGLKELLISSHALLKKCSAEYIALTHKHSFAYPHEIDRLERKVTELSLARRDQEAEINELEKKIRPIRANFHLENIPTPSPDRQAQVRFELTESTPCGSLREHT